MDDHIQLQGVHRPHSVLEVLHTAGCVGGYRDTSMEQLGLFIAIQKESIVTMLMELV